MRRSAPAPLEEPTPPPPIIPGVARALSPLLRRIAHQGLEGEPGLNTYLVGIDEIVIVDPGPGDAEHLDVICGCGGDRIRWIVMTQTSDDYAAGAVELKKKTGAILIAPEGFVGADEILDDGYKIDATEFVIRALSTGNDDDFVYVLEQERSILAGDLFIDGIPDGMPAKVKKFRPKTIAPGHGQFIEDAKVVFGL
ncbi:MAG: hypothetical protein HKN03_18190 [Acidimicrobiales bacterium]|nr:hypothetical protein [Acidimicrobiales bacterium]